MIKGADISALVSNGFVNTEHISPADAGKDEALETDKNASTQGFETIVGRVLRAKKIFSASDCKTPKEMAAWRKFQVPLIYGAIEIWDGPDAHPNAKAAASIAKMLHQNPDGPKLGLSVEGATLKKQGKVLEATVIRDLALTLKPCLRSARIDISGPTDAQAIHKSEYVNSYKGEGEPLFRPSNLDSFFVCEDISHTLLKSLNNLKEAIHNDLKKSDPAIKIATLLSTNRPTAGQIMKAIPSLPQEKAKAVEDYFKQKQLEGLTKIASEFYDTLKTGK